MPSRFIPVDAKQPANSQGESPEDVGLGRRLAAMATRLIGTGVSGVVGAAPTPITTPSAAAIGGGAESIAEWLEGAKQDPKRIALEAALSAVPMGKIYKYGSPIIKNVLRGATLAESGNLLRRKEATGHYLPDSAGDAAWDVGSTVLGGATGFIPVRAEAKPAFGPGSAKGVNYNKPAGLRVALDTLKKSPIDDTTVTKDTIAMHEALAREQMRNPTGPIASEIGPKIQKAVDNSGRTFESGVPIKDRSTLSITDHTALQGDAEDLLEKEMKEPEKLIKMFEDNSRKRDAREAKERLRAIEQEARNEKARGRFLDKRGKEGEKAEDALRKRDQASVKETLAAQKVEAAGKTAAIDFEKNKQLAHEKALSENQKFNEDKVGEANAVAQAENLDKEKGRLTQEVKPTSISESVSGPGEKGGTQRATYRWVEPAKKEGENVTLGGGPPSPANKTYSVLETPSKEEAAARTYTSLKQAVEHANHYGGVDAGITIEEKAGRRYRIKFPGIEPAPKAPKGKAGVGEVIQNSRPWFKINAKEREGLIPAINDAITNGFKGDVEALGDELADRLVQTRDGIQDAHEAGQSQNSLLQFIRRAGGISKPTADLLKKELGDDFKSLPSITNGNVGLSADGVDRVLGEARLKGQFTHIKSWSDFIDELGKIARTKPEKDALSQVLENAKKNPNWWDRERPSQVDLPNPEAVVPTESGSNPDRRVSSQPLPTGMSERRASEIANNPRIPSGPATDTAVAAGKADVAAMDPNKVNSLALDNQPRVTPGRYDVLARNERFEIVDKDTGKVMGHFSKIEEAQNFTNELNKKIQPSTLPGLEDVPNTENPTPPVADLPDQSFSLTSPTPKPPVEGKLPLNPLERSEKDLSEVAERTGVSSGQKPFESGKVVTEPSKGAVISSDENSAPGKLKWEKSEFLGSAPPETQTQTLTDIVNKANKEKGEISPEVFQALTHAGLAAGGALVGAKLTPEDPLYGALIGGTAGMFLPSVARAIINRSSSTQLSDQSLELAGDKIKDGVATFWNMIPDYQRFALLAHNVNLPLNMWVGPYGTTVMAAIEHSLMMDDRGFAAIKLLNPISFMKRWASAIEEAGSHISQAEGRVESSANHGPEWFKRFTATPGVGMTAGDIAARDILMEAGFTEEEARRITLTSEPYSAWGQFLAKGKKGAMTAGGAPSWFANMALPFYRTATNQMEQGLERIPILGFFAEQIMKDVPDSGKQILAKQFVGTGAMGLGAFLGSVIPSGDQKDPYNPSRFWLKFLNNFGGQYGIPMTLGFAIGQAVREGKSWIGASQQRLLQRDLPMPSLSHLYDISTNLRAAIEGDKDFKLPNFVLPGSLNPDQPLNFTTPAAWALEKATGNGLRVAPASRSAGSRFIPIQ